MVDIEQLREALERKNTLNRRLELESDRSLIVAAARELLALKESGQTVWWCEVHSSEASLGDRRCSLAVSLVALGGSPVVKCRMVKASLHIHREGT